MSFFDDQVVHEIAIDIAFLGTYPALLVATIFVCVFLYLQKDYTKCMVLVAYCLATFFAYEALRLLIGISREPITVQVVVDENEGFHLLGHSLMSMSIFLVLAQAMNIGHRWFLVSFAFSLAILIGIARVLMGIRSFDEIALGWALGIMNGILYSRFNKGTTDLHRRATDDHPSLH